MNIGYVIGGNSRESRLLEYVIYIVIRCIDSHYKKLALNIFSLPVVFVHENKTGPIYIYFLIFF